MGALNVKLAYAAYAGKVPPLSMQLLAYMAVVSLDSDPEPWFGQGHGALAEEALGRDAPVQEKDIRAVERAIAPLLKVGAIVADRRPAPRRDAPSTARYRLALPRTRAPRKPVDDAPRAGDVPRNPVDERPTVSGGDVPRNPAERPTESDETSHGNRGTEEKEEEEETGGVSQSAGEREATRWLHGRYGLTDSEAAAVVGEVRRRAPKPIKHLVPYMDGMAEGDLADIAAAAMATPEPQPQPQPLTAVEGTGSKEPPPAVQRPMLAAVQDEEGERDALGLPAVSAREALRRRLQQINAGRNPDAQRPAR